jgi:hypothetical protein
MATTASVLAGPGSVSAGLNVALDAAGRQVMSRLERIDADLEAGKMSPTEAATHRTIAVGAYQSTIRTVAAIYRSGGSL